VSLENLQLSICPLSSCACQEEATSLWHSPIFLLQLKWKLHWGLENTQKSVVA